MRKFLLRRFAFLIPQLFVVSFLAFLLIKLLPGDPVLIILGPLRTQEGVIRETKRLGLDKPFSSSTADTSSARSKATLAIPSLPNSPSLRSWGAASRRPCG